MSRAERAERSVELLQRVGISADRRRSYPHELSGGMRQRAAIAIALALNPEIIIMDEPTTALDVVVQRDILGEIRALREEYGFAVVFITHDLSLLMEISDRIAIMYAGRVVESGTAKGLHRAPRHPYTMGLLRSFPRLRGPREELLGIPGTPPDLRSPPPGCAFHPRCGLAVDECAVSLPVLTPGATARSRAC
ncbi:oligopeptide/dipeptide ABC transporter ATP-binding protein [Nonomuraea antimicrobica]